MARRTQRIAPAPGVYSTSTGTAELVPHRDDPGLWTVLVNGVPSSSVRPDDPARLDFEYLQYMAVCLSVQPPQPPHPLSVLHLGGAACALAWALETVRPGSEQVVLEIDEELVRLVRLWFDLPRSPRLRIQAVDARAGLARRRDASADAVVRDAFDGSTTPEHLSTLEATQDVRRVLRPSGIYLANVADRPPLQVLRREIATVAAVFEHTAVIAETAMLRGRRYANAVVLGSSTPVPVVALGRALAATGVSVRVVHGERLRDLVAGSPPYRDLRQAGDPPPEL